MARLNMRELALKLGVDRATVSRALSNDKAHLVAPATRERIRQAAGAAGYRPDLTAATLRRGRSHTVGILVSDLGNETFIEVIRTIFRHLDARSDAPSITPLIAETLDQPDATRRLIHTFLSRRVDAIISLASTEADTAILQDAAREVPVVLAIRAIAGAVFPSALCDDRAGGAMVATHFAERGHKIVCQVQGPPLSATFKNRALGFSEVCASRSIVEMPQRIFAETATSAAGKRTLDALLAVSPRPTAIFAHNDALALGVIEAMRHRGLRCPEDLAIVGFNNTQLSRILAVPLSTVDYPVEEVSRHAGELVRNLIADPSYRFESRLFTPSLIVRASS
ncbi:LacI family DNA-binding transcriptional regulator [Mesorhizobium metallidurans]|nr:LacI family DNA-binding transcriptional regulator [Mesorhizobium metallidurans]